MTIKKITIFIILSVTLFGLFQNATDNQIQNQLENYGIEFLKNSIDELLVERSDIAPTGTITVSRSFRDFDYNLVNVKVYQPRDEGPQNLFPTANKQRVPCPIGREDQYEIIKQTVALLKNTTGTKKLQFGNCSYYVYMPPSAKAGIDLSGFQDLIVSGVSDGDRLPLTKIIFVAPTYRTEYDFMNTHNMAMSEVAKLVPDFKHGFLLTSGDRIMFKNFVVDFIAPVSTSVSNPAGSINWTSEVSMHSFGEIERIPSADHTTDENSPQRRLRFEADNIKFISPMIRKIVSMEDGDSHKIAFSRYNHNEPFDIDFSKQTSFDLFKQTFRWARDKNGIYLESAKFNALPLGHRMRLSHASGGDAFNFQTISGVDLAKDISLINIKIQGSPGVGVVFNMNKGLFISNLKIDEPTGFLARRATSVGSGGVVGAIKSDFILEKSSIRHTIDDSLNLYPVTKFPKKIEKRLNSLFVETGSVNMGVQMGDLICFYEKNWTVKGCAEIQSFGATRDELILLDPQNQLANLLLGAAEQLYYDPIDPNSMPYVVSNINQNGSRSYVSENIFENGNAGVVFKASNSVIRLNTFNQIAEGLSVYAKFSNANLQGATVRNVCIRSNTFRNVGASGEGSVINFAGFMPKDNYSGPQTINYDKGIVPSKGYSYSTRLIQKVVVGNNIIYSALVPPLWLNNVDDARIYMNSSAQDIDHHPNVEEDGIFLSEWNGSLTIDSAHHFWKLRREEIVQGQLNINQVVKAKDIRAKNLNILGSCGVQVGFNQPNLSDSARQFRLWETCN